MNLVVSIPDKVGAPLTAKADWTFEPTLEQATQPVRINWGDGTAVDAVASGTLTKTHTYAKEGFFNVVAQANDVRQNFRIKAGTPDYNAAVAGKFARSQERLREDTASVLGVTGKLGTPTPLP
jgi:hypothetical protein